MYCQSVVRIGAKDKQPIMIMAFMKDAIAKYLGSKKYYWIRVYLAKMNDKKVNAKSIMGMMSLGLDAGEKLTAVVDGPDEEAAIEGIDNYLSGK